MKTLFAVIATAVMMLGARSGLADDSFYCGDSIISTGDEKFSVEQHCGKPDQIEEDKWIYERGPEQMTLIVHFDQDIVSLIEEVPND